MTALPQALVGLKVLEFGGFAAGPHIGKILANFGAQTIHVESRDRPDGFRVRYPPFKDGRIGYNRSGCFAFFNDSKYSVTVDLKKPAGVELARRLAQWCDLVVENMRPGVMERLGLGYDTLAALNRRLIMLSTCNMGQTGPRADQPGFGSQLSALAGFCGMTGVPDGPPMLLYGPYIDYVASLLGASAALAAVFRTRRSGKGCNIDVSQYECGLVFMAGALHDYFANGHVAQRRGNEDTDAAPHGAFPCRDDTWVVLSCWSDAEFAALAGVMGKPDLADDQAYATLSARRMHQKQLGPGRERLMPLQRPYRRPALLPIRSSPWPVCSRTRNCTPGAISASAAIRKLEIIAIASPDLTLPDSPATSLAPRPALEPITSSSFATCLD